MDLLEGLNDESKLEDLILGLTDCYNDALDNKNYILSALLKEELRKLVENSGPLFKIDSRISTNLNGV